MYLRSGFAGVLACVLAACGGGGGGGDNGNGGSRGNTITVDRTRVDLHTDDYYGFGASVDVIVNFSGAGVVVGTLPGQTAPIWLNVFAPQTVTTQSARVTLGFFQQGIANQPQRNSVTLRFATADADGTRVAYRDIVVTATLDHRLSRYESYLTHTRGASTAPVAAVDVQTTNATWVASSDAPWLQVSPASGTGAATLDLTTAPGTLPEGDHLASVTVKDTVTNYSRVLRVHLGVDPRRLEASHRTLAFSETLAGSRLSRTTRLVDTANLSGHWTATSNAQWLHVTPASGSGNTTLTVTADPAAVADGAHVGQINIAPDNEPDITNTEVIRAGLYVDRSTPVAAGVDIGLLNGHGANLAVHPLLPYLYKTQGYSPDQTLEVWNMYTATRLGTPLPMPNVGAWGLCQAPDGTRLLLIDSNNNRIQVVDIDGAALTLGPAWPVNGLSPILLLGCTTTRISGRDVLLGNNGMALSIDDGAQLTSFAPALGAGVGGGSSVSASPDGRYGFVTGTTSGNHSLWRLILGNRAGTVSVNVTDLMRETNGGIGVVFSPLSEYAYSLTSQNSFIHRYPVGSLTSDLTVDSPAYFSGALFAVANGDLYLSWTGGWTHYDADLNVLGTRSMTTDGTWGRISSDGGRMFEIRSGAAMAWGYFSTVDF